MSRTAFVIGIAWGVLVGSPVGWVVAVVLIWWVRRQQVADEAKAAAPKPSGPGLRLVDDEQGSAS